MTTTASTISSVRTTTLTIGPVCRVLLFGPACMAPPHIDGPPRAPRRHIYPQKPTLHVST